MSDFHDPDLRQQLGRLSGPYPDDNEAFAAWQRRVGQVQRRRAVAWTTGAALSLILGTVAFAAVQAPDSRSVVPGETADTSEVSITVQTTEAEAVAEDTTTMPQARASETTEPTLASDTTPTSEVVDTSAPEAPEPTAAAGSPPSVSAPKGQTRSPTTPAPTAAQPITQMFESIGGTVTVRRDGDERLTIIATNPAPGFRTDDDDPSGEKVSVTFKSDNHESRISVKLSDGIMKPDIDEDEREQHDTTVPEESDGDRDRDRGRDD